ncbi:MAG TPA: hypothetical protein VE223_07540 [Nitrososphaeraceae archaeon]|nr:hypothetical protein [Nitrososphaeraceae archaeon]
MFGKGKNKEEQEEAKRKYVERFYILLSSLMNELFEYAATFGHVKMPYNVSFGLIHDKRDSVLLKGIDQKTGKKMYLYNTRIIAKMFEERREQMLKDNTTNTLFGWISDVCSLYIRPFVYEYVVEMQHRGEGAAERTTRQIVREFIDKLLNDPELKYVLDNMKEGDSTNKSAV